MFISILRITFLYLRRPPPPPRDERILEDPRLLVERALDPL
jgi:hypothetical protein